MRETCFLPSHALPDADSGALIFPFFGGDCVLLETGSLPDAHALAPFGPPRERLLIGHLDGRPCELWLWPAEEAVAHWPRADYRRMWGVWSDARLQALARARQLATWLREHRYCGVCGAPLRTSASEPARECADCGHKVYPRISPVCIGLVVRDDHLLLGRSPHFPPGIYSALAGFVEAGESAEDCLRREIREEAGIEISNLRWFSSQSWPYPHSLMLGFYADYAGGELCPQPGEIEDLQWFHRDALPTLPHDSALARWMIDAWLAGNR